MKLISIINFCAFIGNHNIGTTQHFSPVLALE